MSVMRSLMLFMQRRRQAYRAIFMPGGQSGPAAEIVLSDLRKFCRATAGTTVVSPTQQRVDPIASAILEGRREVWNRIAQNLHLSDADIYRLVDPEGQPKNEQGTDY